LFFQRNEVDKAIADFDVVLRMDPRDAASYAARSYLHKQKGDAARAAADLEQARKLGWTK
jgi:Flp pilus assembly protein TadD